MKYNILTSLIISIVFLAGSSCSHRIVKTYSNPVVTADAPDPSVIRAGDGKYYLYATGHGYSIFRSDDLVSWKRIGPVFTDETWPSAIRNGRRGDLWAPEIRRIDDKYVLFYTLWFGDVKYSVIGYAVADNPQGPFVDKGVLIDSQEIGVPQSIDQFYYEEGGKAWIFWGSFRNLYVMELDVADGVVITPRPETKQLFAGTAFEGTNIYKRNGWYYFFASTGDFSGGTESTYRTVVARSRNLLGPYLDKEGRNILDNGHTVIMERNEKFSGPGHNAGLIEDARGRTWMFYHAYDTSAPDIGRQGMLDEVRWDKDGWPYIATGTPSPIAKAPVID